MRRTPPILRAGLLGLLALAIAAADTKPRSADLRPLFDGWKLPVRPQGKRGTCSVFTVAGALEFALARKERRGTRLSVEFLNWAANKVVGKAKDGGFFSDIWKGFQTYGVCPEKDMPYRKTFQPGLEPADAALRKARSVLRRGLRIHWIKKWNPNKGLTGAQLGEVQKTLDRGWPVCGGFLWPKRAVWKENVLQMCPRKDVRDGHSVLLAGYRLDAMQPGGGVFIVRDSKRMARDEYLTFEYIKTYMNDALWIDFERTPRPERSSRR